MTATTTCPHEATAVIRNAAGTPVRVWCACGQDWRVIPHDPTPEQRAALVAVWDRQIGAAR